MRDLKESFKVDDVEKLQKIIITSGKKLNWNPVSISNNEVEFNYGKHLTNFYTVVTWNDEGFINISSNYRRKSIKVDIGGYRKASNNKIKLSILRELEFKKKLESNEDKQVKKVIETNNQITNKRNNVIGNKNASNNKKGKNYSKQIYQQDHSLNRKISTLIITGVIILIFILIYNIFIPENLCGCSEREIAYLQGQNVWSRSEAIEFCCELKKNKK